MRLAHKMSQTESHHQQQAELCDALGKTRQNKRTTSQGQIAFQSEISPRPYVPPHPLRPTQGLCSQGWGTEALSHTPKHACHSSCLPHSACTCFCSPTLSPSLRSDERFLEHGRKLEGDPHPSLRKDSGKKQTPRKSRQSGSPNQSKKQGFQGT